MADDSTRDDADGGEERPRPQRPARPAGFGRPEDRPGRAGRPGWDRDRAPRGGDDRGPRGGDRGARGDDRGPRGGFGGRDDGGRGDGGRGRGGDRPDGRGGPRPDRGPGGGYRGREDRGGERGGREGGGFRGREDRGGGGYRGREDRGGGYRGREGGGGYRPRDRDDRGGPGGPRDGGYRPREDRGGFRGGEDRGGFRGGGDRGREDRGGGFRGRDDRGGFRGRDDRGRAPAPPAVPLISTDEDADALADEVLDARRTRPIVCLTTRVGEDRPALDARRIKEAIGRRCELRAVRTGSATRTLAERLPPQHGVFGGAARIWWPGVGELDSRDHPLILDRQGVYGPRALENTLVAFDEGPPADARPRPVPVRDDAPALDGLEAVPDVVEPDVAAVPAPATPAGSDAELAAARAEVARLRERLAEVRLDAVSGAPAEAPAAPTPRLASAERLAHAAIPEAVLREPERLRHLELVAAWLLLDGDGVRRERPLGHVALGEGYPVAIAAHEERVAPAEVAAVAARAVGGRPGDASELDVRSELDPTEDPVARGDGAALWSCAISGTDLRLRWWTRPDGAVELADLAEPGAAPPTA